MPAQSAPRRYPATPLLLFALLLVSAPLAGQEAVPPPHDWAPALAPAWAAYLSGDYPAARRYCEGVRTKLDDPRAKQDVELLTALCLLHHDSRHSRIEGRARLDQLRDEDPTLVNDPECLLAAGIAQLKLHETADALDKLDRAVAGFAEQDLPRRELAALPVLAEAWASHTEWEATPPRFNIAQPNPNQTYRDIRRARINTIRNRITSLPDHEQALASIDLTSARLLLTSRAGADQGRQILRRLAHAPRLNTPRAAAAAELAQDAEDRADFTAALELYELLQRRWQGELAEHAARRAAHIRSPQIQLNLPETARPHALLDLDLRVRGIDTLELNVRQVDLEEWLSDPTHRGNEARLPEFGSVRAAFDLDTATATPYGWWTSADSTRPPRLELPTGDYVAVARGVDRTGREHIAKHLLNITNLVATCIVGTEHMLIWAQEHAPDQPGGFVTPAGTCRARFWMQHSFTPREVALDPDLALFDLPPESNLTRDRRWYCLLQSDNNTALCRGLLPDPSTRPNAPRLALVAGPPVPRPGGSLHLAGLLHNADADAPLPAGDLVQIQVVDVIERELFAQSLPVGPGGTFSVDVPLPPDVGDRHIRVRCRHQQRLLTNLLGQIALDTAATNHPQFRVDIDVPPWTGDSHSRVVGQVRATYPWGSVPPRMRIICKLDAVQLPQSGPLQAPQILEPITRAGRLDQDGSFPLWIPVNNFGPIDGPCAVGISATVQSWEGRRGNAQAEVLAGPQPAHAWLVYTPQTPTVNTPVRFHVGWYQPKTRTILDFPAVELTSDGSTIDHLPLHPGETGLATKPWRPPAAATYSAHVRIPALDDEPLTASTTFTVEPGPDTTAVTLASPRLSPADPAPHVTLQLDGAVQQPLLALIEDGQPLAATSITPTEQPTHLNLTLPPGSSGPARVALYALQPTGLSLLANLPVEPPSDTGFKLKLNPPDHELWPGTVVPVSVSADTTLGTGPIALVARLINANSAGHTSPIESATDPAGSPPRINVTTNLPDSHARAPSAPTQLPAAELPAELEAGFREGNTLWCTATTLEQHATQLPVPLPPTPGLYKLILIARSPDGRVTRAAQLLDARRGLDIHLDLPSRLIVGDRTLLALRIENNRPEIISAEVNLASDAGLHIDAIRIIRSGLPAETHPAGRPLKLDVQPQTVMWIHADAEATHVGDQAASAEITSAGRTRRLAAACHVLPLPPQQPASYLQIERSVSVWAASERAVERAGVRGQRGPVLSRSELHDQLGDEDDQVDELQSEDPEWFWMPVEPNQQLQVGQFLRVVETVTLEQPLSTLTWTQHLPPTCHTVSATPEGYDPIGRRLGRQATVLNYQVSPLDPGTYTHQYFLAVVRPGVGLLPPPSLRTPTADLPARVDPPATRTVVLPAD